MKSITASSNDSRDIREIFREAGFDKRDVDVKLNRVEGTVTYSQPDIPKKKQKKAPVKRCQNCGTVTRCPYYCTCLEAYKEKEGKHGKFYFCSERCVAMHHRHYWEEETR